MLRLSGRYFCIQLTGSFVLLVKNSGKAEKSLIILEAGAILGLYSLTDPYALFDSQQTQQQTRTAKHQTCLEGRFSQVKCADPDQVSSSFLVVASFGHGSKHGMNFDTSVVVLNFKSLILIFFFRTNWEKEEVRI
ncbi:hypothetical protein VNO78_34745 [Psophocarpus tetragonolobus]|uniref:Uncharacterized protein n=1 Tax=Psophocarpus tetragonolobus TaxID=3891 RepID=A0AAN9RKQ9_PSOTE